MHTKIITTSDEDQTVQVAAYVGPSGAPSFDLCVHGNAIVGLSEDQVKELMVAAEEAIQHASKRDW